MNCVDIQHICPELGVKRRKALRLLSPTLRWPLRHPYAICKLRDATLSAPTHECGGRAAEPSIFGFVVETRAHRERGAPTVNGRSKSTY